LTTSIEYEGLYFISYFILQFLSPDCLQAVLLLALETN
jgi:hypothetical protein